VSAQTVNFVFATLATFGLFFIVGGITGRIRLSLAEHPGALGQFESSETFMRLPLAARMARSIMEVLPLGRFGLEDEALEVDLARAGNPYDSPLQFYQRKLAYMGLYAAGTVVLGVLLGLPMPLILLAALIAGVFGLISPESVIADRIHKRRDELRREMAFMLDRVGFAVMAYGTFQETLSQMSALMGPEVGGAYKLPFEERARVTQEFEQESRKFQAALGTGMVGMGGGLFAEFLNQLAMLLSAGTGDGFKDLRGKLERVYPVSAEVTSFLDIVEAGLRGSPMAERLFELADDMVEEMAQEQREAGMRATLVVTATAGAILIPLLLVVGGPAFSLVLDIFGS
jgi:hypothetical protein